MRKKLGSILCVLGCLIAVAGTEPLPPNNAALAPHARDLVVLSGDKLAPFDAQQFLRARYIVLYFGAGWCPDCRRFSPSLVQAYDRQPAEAREYEVLLLSRDKDAAGMLGFMKQEMMKWPALAFDKISAADDLNRFYSGRGIPCLTVIDSSGKIVLQSETDQDGKEVLGRFEALLAKSRKK